MYANIIAYWNDTQILFNAVKGKSRSRASLYFLRAVGSYNVISTIEVLKDLQSSGFKYTLFVMTNFSSLLGRDVTFNSTMSNKIQNENISKILMTSFAFLRILCKQLILK